MAIAVGNPSKITGKLKVVKKSPTWNAKGAGQGGDESPNIQGKENPGGTPMQGSRNVSPQGGNRSTEDSGTPTQGGTTRRIQGTGGGLKAAISQRMFGKKKSAK